MGTPLIAGQGDLLCQDLNRGLSKWLATRPGARYITERTIMDTATFEPAVINLPPKGVLWLTFYTDPGHGWLEVPHELLSELQVIPSAFSYRNFKFSYLEEDCDASAFMEAAKTAGYTINIKHINEPRNDSFIRSLARWH